MVLYSKSIFDDVLEDDGLRISVMSRHTLNDGVTADSRLEGKFTYWMPELGPPATLVGDHYKRGLSWDGFSERYVDYLRTDVEVSFRVNLLSRLALSCDVTVLCVEPLGENCHRRLLLDECAFRYSELNTGHR
ncbi:MAG: hypothetical protein ACI83O_000152 [Patescibacteria group bacterium]|jgi:uncharacterized protein YeaO (DUF488 family)